MPIKKKIINIPIKDKTSGKKLQMIQFSNRKFTKAQIRKEVQSLSKELKEGGGEGEIMSSIYYGNDSPIKWAGGSWTAFGKKVSLFNIVEYEGDADDWQEPEYVTKFNLFIRNKK